MKKLTILLSMLMVAFSSVFAQDPVLSLNPRGEQAFADQSYVKGENIVLLDTLKAAVTAENVEKASLAIAKKDAESVFKAEFNEDSTEVWVSYSFAAAKGSYRDSVIVSAGALADTLVVSLNVEEKVPVITTADAIDWGTVEVQDAKAGIEKEIAASVSEGVALSVEVSGEQAANFAAELKDGKLVVKLTAQKAGLYNAVATLKAAGAENQEVKLSAYVKWPDPIISVKPAEWSINLTMQVVNGVTSAQAEKAVVISSKYLIDDLNVAIKGGKSSKFAWDEENQKVTFYSTVAGAFKDTLVVSSEGAETQKVPLSAIVQMPAPQLTVKPGEWKTSIELQDGKAEAERSFSISGKYLIADIAIAIKEAKSPFVWNDEEQKVSFSASETGIYKGTLVVSTEGAETIEVAMEVEVKEGQIVPPATPVITVGATELAWGEVELDAAKAGIAKETTASVTEGATLSVEVSGAQAANFAAELKEGKLIVTFKAAAAGAYAAVATLKAEGAESKTVALSATVKEGSVPPQPGGSVTWITDPSELKAGDKIVLTNSDKTKAMSTAQTAVEGKSYYRGETDFNENNISAEVEQIELVASGSNFKLKVTGGYLYFDDAWMTAGTGGKKVNWLGTNESGSDFKFEKTEDGIYAVEVKNDGLILYNGGSTRFSHYARSSSLVKSGATLIAVIGGQSAPAAVTGVTLDKATATVQISKTITLTATVAPANAGNKSVTWASSNEAVATVANGVVTGVAEGTATITVTTVEGAFTAQCVVTVTKDEVVPATPVITVGATELAWGEVEATAAQAGIAKETTASVTEGATLSVEVSGAQAANFKAELKDGKLIVTFKASAAGAYAATATLKAEGAESKAVALSATVKEMQVDGITVAKALELGAPLADQEVSAESYTIIGYVSAMQNSEDGGWAQYGNQIFWIADDPASTANSNADGAFEVYQGVCSEQVYVGDKVYVVTKLKNYKGTIESETKAPVTIMVKGPNHPAGGGGEETEEADVVILGADFAGQGTAQTGSPVEVTKDGITFTCDKGYSDDEHQTLRCYKNSVITITSATEQIGKFVFQFYSTYDGGLDKEVVVNAKEWTYTLPAQARIEKLSIFFGEYEEKPVDPGEVVPELPDGVISCDSAVVLAAEIEDPAEVKGTVEGGAVVVRGWVSFAYDAKDGKQSAWLSDTKGSKSGVIQAAYLQVEEAVAVGDYVEIEGTLAKYLKAGKDGAANEVVIEVINGTMKKVDTQGIEDVVLSEKAHKVMIDGTLYIIRDNKMYNIQGARVR